VYFNAFVTCIVSYWHLTTYSTYGVHKYMCMCICVYVYMHVFIYVRKHIMFRESEAVF
jgi:hypothetical protein